MIEWLHLILWRIRVDYQRWQLIRAHKKLEQLRWELWGKYDD